MSAVHANFLPVVRDLCHTSTTMATSNTKMAKSVAIKPNSGKPRMYIQLPFPPQKNYEVHKTENTKNYHKSKERPKIIGFNRKSQNNRQKNNHGVQRHAKPPSSFVIP